jgi:HK97 family phage prohead protease
MIELLEKKIHQPYRVSNLGNSTKDIDPNKRIVKGVFNSFFLIDEGMDMTVPGAFAKSIGDRGPLSSATNKIKHLQNHDWDKNIARIDFLKEEDIHYDGINMQGLVHESYYPNTQDGNDMLVKIQEGIYDNRSIGYQVVNFEVAERDTEDEQRKATWEEYYPKALNPEKADEAGFFFVLKELKLFEGSDVSFGMNSLTPLLDIKSNSEEDVLNYLFGKLDKMKTLFKSGNLSEKSFHKLDMEHLQIKSYISDIINSKPSLKGIVADNRNEVDTKEQDKEEVKRDTLKKLLKSYE